MNRGTVLLIILIITLIGGFLRIWKITENPVSLNIDEVSYGYSAYSLLKTGRDENGQFLPLSFASIGDYKNPVLIYSLVPSIALFGLNEFSVRITTALFGILSIPIFFLLLKSLFKNTWIGIIGSLLLAISPWHIYYSRHASDHLVGTFFLILGVYSLLKMLDYGKVWSLLSSVFLILSIYAYHSNRLFDPILLTLFPFLYPSKIKRKKSSVYLFLIISLILIIPLIYLSFFGPANTRFKMVFITQDIDLTRYVILDHLFREFKINGLLGIILTPYTIFSHENFLTLFFWIGRYLNYFSPEFLFFTGLNMTYEGIYGLGVLYLFELPWLILGVYFLFKKKFENRWLVFGWLLLGFIPASLTNNIVSAGRSLIALPAVLTIISVGCFYFIKKLISLRNIYLKIFSAALYFLFIILTLISAFLVFAVHFPLERGDAFMDGTKESVMFLLNAKENYKEIVYDPFRGINAQNIVNVPHTYILFYSLYDPGRYQTELKSSVNEVFRFDKFTIRRIDWRTDRYNNNVLFIGSPWSLPEKDLKKEEILKRIYLQNGDLVLIIATPKQN